MTLEAGRDPRSRRIEAAEAAGAMFPLWLASQGSARIGGVLSSNAGGVQVLAFGNARELTLGVEAVLADGRLYQGLNALKKDNTGYDLKDLLVGAEGTLGIITAATLKLFPQPEAQETAIWSTSPGPEVALELFYLLRERAGSRLTAFELMPRFGIDLQLKHDMLSRDPTAGPSPWYALVEVNRMKGGAPGALQAALEEALGAGLVSDAVLAESEADRTLMWAAREQMSEVQSREGRLDQARRLGADRRRAAADRRGQRGGGAGRPRHPPLPVRAHGRRQHPLQLQPAGRRRPQGVHGAREGRQCRRSTRWCCGSAARSRPSTASGS